MKKPSFLLITGLILLSSGTLHAATISFPDVPTTAWFYTDVMNLVNWGVIQGNADGTFKPNDYVNRAELATMWNRYDQRVQSLIANSSSSNFNTQVSDPTLENRVTLLEYKVDAMQISGTQNLILNDEYQSSSTYCPNLKNSDSEYTLAEGWYATLEQTYSQYENTIPYIKTNLNALNTTFQLISSNCGY